MLSGHAEAIYWLGRYLERAEDSARLANVHANLLLDLPRKYTLGWAPLIAITGHSELFAEFYKETNERTVVRFLIADEKNPGSIISSLTSARDNARLLRDLLPREAWEQINVLFLSAKQEAANSLTQAKRYDFLESVIRGAQQIYGTLAGTMSHDYPYDFLRLGLALERVDMTTRIIDVRSANLLGAVVTPDMANADLAPFENIQWMSVLRSLSAYHMYRRTVRGPVSHADVLRFLLSDKYFPRSITFCLAEMDATLRRLPRSSTLARSIQKMIDQLDHVDYDALDQPALHRYTDELQVGFGALHDQISATYFLPGVPAQAQSQSQSQAGSPSQSQSQSS
ncbi:MAG: alpha-E domain-containing protein, partial [Proteobacteria bacterium]|nr:alpha-E domain-containing protein [Burkholderiales bacterium]